MRLSARIVCALVLVAGGAGVAGSAPRKARAKRPPLPSLVLPPEPSARDLAIGRACQQGLGRVQGAVVAMDPYTGRVMALVNPRYGLTTAYQPCSVFKIVVAIAGLSEGAITPATRHVCSGGCWSWPGHGSIDLRRALAVSCNPYFERVGEELGYAQVERYAHLLGLGEPSGINLTGEAKGTLPTHVSPAAVGHLSSHAAGIRTSAVQLAVLVSATLNGGIVYQPQVANAEAFSPRERWRLPAGTRTDGLAAGFMAAVNEGSASGAFDPQIVVAGKTGTCSGVGWFASYAPADRPEVVIVVFMRRGSGAGASSIAGRVYENLYGSRDADPTIAGGGGGGR
jgi:cell division protein FtsI/penicillin-binding protein 2